MKKLIGIAAAAAFGLGAFGLATSADARIARVVVAPAGYSYGSGYYHWYSFPPSGKWNTARYIACRKKVFPERGYGSAYLFAVDYCYAGFPW
jgi:hypothetical protein